MAIADAETVAADNGLMEPITMTVAPEFAEASGRAAIRALRGLEQTAIMLEKWGPETFPAGPDGKIHFGRAMTDATAEAIRDAWRVAIREVEHFPPTGGLVEQIGNLRHALGKIADLEDSVAGEPLDDAIAIAKAALSQHPGAAVSAHNEGEVK